MIVIHLARKPLSEPSVAANAVEHGTGGLNIDGTRIRGPVPNCTGQGFRTGKYGGQIGHGETTLDGQQWENSQGRWPANLILEHRKRCRVAGTRKVKKPGGHTKWPDYDGPEWQGMQGKHSQVAHYDPDGLETVDEYVCVDGCPVADLDEQSAALNIPPAGNKKAGRISGGGGLCVYKGGWGDTWRNPNYHPDTGGASRFFKQVEPDHDFKRSHHLALCPECGKTYIDHPTDGRMPFLHVLCDGTRVKL